MHTLEDFQIRPFSLTKDFSNLLAFLRTTADFDANGRRIDEDAQKRSLELPGHQPEFDRWVIYSTGESAQMVGHGMLWVNPADPEHRTAELSIMVHPQFRRQGLGSQLVSRLLARAQELNAESAVSYAWGTEPAPFAFAAKHNFDPTGVYCKLRADGNVPPPNVDLPAGFSIRSYAEVQDLSAAAHAMHASYLGQWAHTPVSNEQMAEFLTRFDADGLLLLFAPDRKVAGISRVECSKKNSTENGRPTGFIDSPGVLAEYRSPALYLSLLKAGILWLQTRGQELIEIESWGEPDERLNAYRQLGFTEVVHITEFHKNLNSSSNY